MSAALRHSGCVVALPPCVLTLVCFPPRDVASTGRSTPSSRAGIKERTPGSRAGLACVPRYAEHRLLAINARSTDDAVVWSPARDLAGQHKLPGVRAMRSALCVLSALGAASGDARASKDAGTTREHSRRDAAY